MGKEKNFTLDEKTLEAQRNKLGDMIEGDQEAIAVNAAITRDQQLAHTQHPKWAEARLKGNLDALNRHQKMYEDTIERMNKLKDSSNQESEGCGNAIKETDSE